MLLFALIERVWETGQRRAVATEYRTKTNNHNAVHWVQWP